LSQAQTSINFFLEKVESTSNRIEDKIAALYSHAEDISNKVDVLMLNFKEFMRHFKAEALQIRDELRELREGLHER